MARRVTFGGVEVFRIPNREDVAHEVPDWVLYADDGDGADADDEADGADVADAEDSDDDEAGLPIAWSRRVTLARLNAFKNRAPPTYARRRGRHGRRRLVRDTASAARVSWACMESDTAET